MREPHLTECCGHNYCGSCIQAWLMSSLPDSCPFCRSSVLTHIQDKRIEREIRAMSVKCCHAEEGCDWVGSLSDLERHLTSKSNKECGYVMTECPSGCGMCMLRKELQAHAKAVCKLRSVCCEYCGVCVTYEEMVIKHYSECPLMEITCEKGCGKTMKRCEAATHLNEECPNHTIECPFQDSGCDVVLARKDFDEHVSTCKEKYLVKAFMKMKTDLEKVKQENISLREQLNEAKQNSESCQKNVEMVNETTQVINDALLQELCRLHPSKAPSELVALECIITMLSGKIFLDTESGEVATFRMTDYVRYKSSGEVWYSPAFYVKGGYKFCLALHLNGTGVGKGTHVTLCLHQMKGEHDRALTWPFLLEGVLELNFLRQSNAKYSWLKVSKKPTGSPSPTNRSPRIPRTPSAHAHDKEELFLSSDDSGSQNGDFLPTLNKSFSHSHQSTAKDSPRVRSRSTNLTTKEINDLVMCTEECQELYLNMSLERPRSCDTISKVAAPVRQIELFCLQKIMDSAVHEDSLVIQCRLNPACTNVDRKH